MPVIRTTNLTSLLETSDASATTSTTYNMTVGDTFGGTITSTDHDYVRINLVAGQQYTFSMVATGSGTTNFDTYLRLRDSVGTEIGANDDGGPGLNSTIAFTATTTGAYYLDAAGFDSFETGAYQLSATTGSRANYNIAMAAGALLENGSSWSASRATPITVTYGYRQNPATYTVSGSNIATFTQVSATERAAVQLALAQWSELCGLTFQEINPGGFTDSATMLIGNYTDATDGAGAFALFPGSTTSTAQAGDVWLNTTSIDPNAAIGFGSYSRFAIIHELGHTLGLSHPGDYNAAPGVSITYANDAQFNQDSAQYSIMSYFDETETGANYGGYADTPQMADIYAAQQLYGVNTSTRSGATVYGYNSNAGSVYDLAVNTNGGFCIWDGGGADYLSGSGYSGTQSIDLNTGSYSDMNGFISNVSIALGTVVENAIGGTGADNIYGNDVNNNINGNLGSDTISSARGNDTIVGIEGDGNDSVDGGSGTDITTFNYQSSLATISHNANGSWTISSAGSTDSLTNIEQARFTDRNISLRDRTRSDLNGNGTSVLLYRDMLTGSVTDWVLSNGQFVGSTQLGGIGSNIQTAGTGDFNNDGTSDILLRDFTTGALTEWSISNNSFAGSHQLGGMGSNILIVGTGDFDNDGTSDVLLRDTLTGAVTDWGVSDHTFAGSHQFGGIGSNIQIAGTGDFDGDGTTDILFRDETTGAVTDWSISNNNFNGSHQFGGIGSSIQIAGCADFNADGTSDVLLRDLVSGNVSYWSISNNAFSGSTTLGGLAASTQVAGVGDYNNDGSADVLLRTANGGVFVWLTNNGAFGSQIAVGGAGLNILSIG